MIKTKAYLISMFMIATLMLASSNLFATVYDASKTYKVIGVVEDEMIERIYLRYEQAMDTMHTTETIGFIETENILLSKMKAVLENKAIKLRSDPNPDAKIMKILPTGEKVNPVCKSDNWYQVILEDGTEGFLYKTQLQTNGLELFLAEAESNTPIEVIQWEEASKLLARGDVATIEDVYTGRTFEIKRTFGTNHADVEALTKEDTVNMEHIWGGFSWERRPVIVHVKGRSLAASLAGMPHAGDSLDAVSDNEMSGVIDLHFRGSRKHKEGHITATVDPLHQDAITIATEYKR